METLATQPQSGIEQDILPKQVTTEPTPGGFLVFENIYEYSPLLGRRKKIGRHLKGFADVSDWDEIVSALRSHGIDHGAIYHLPEMELSEIGALI